MNIQLKSVLEDHYKTEAHIHYLSGYQKFSGNDYGHGTVLFSLRAMMIKKYLEWIQSLLKSMGVFILTSVDYAITLKYRYYHQL